MKLKHKIILIFIFVISFASVFTVFFMECNVAKKIKEKGNISFSFLIYGTQKLFPKKMEAWTALYEPKNKIAKIISINVDAVILSRTEKARSLKENFNLDFEKDKNFAIKNFYSNLKATVGNAADTDFFIHIDFETFNKIFSSEKMSMFSKYENVENKLEIVETFFRSMNLMSFKFLLNYKLFDTNIERNSFFLGFFKLFTAVKMKMFCEMPIKNNRQRVEPDKENIEKFLQEVYFKDFSLQTEEQAKVEIKNASSLRNAAKKATWLLRDNNEYNKFDIIDYGNSKMIYNKSIVVDRRGYFKQSLSIASILKTNKILVLYDANNYCDITVFVGKDFKLPSNSDSLEDWYEKKD
jgi:hypothetical protein